MSKFKVGDIVRMIQESTTVKRTELGTVTDVGSVEIEVTWNNRYMSLYRADEIELVAELFPTETASKNDTKKVDLSLIPMIAQIEEAKALMVGEKKYGRYNYTKGHKASQLVAAALRHIGRWNEGEEFDPEDGQHHLGAARACMAMALRQQELGTLNDDRFKKKTEGSNG